MPVLPSSPPRIRTARLVLTLPTREDAPELLAYGLRNLEHLVPWSPPPPAEGLSLEIYQRLVTRSRREFEEGQSVRLWARLGDATEGPFVGAVSLLDINLGAFRACILGYHIDRAFEGKGYMSEAVAAVVRYAFEELKLHRIMANYVPHNVRSARLLERLGFVKEGYAKEYLFIHDRWQDHVLTSLTNRELGDAKALVAGGG
jgi:ribosomal-protein-alanine N-acetyltransferase